MYSELKHVLIGQYFKERFNFSLLIMLICLVLTQILETK